MKRIILLMLVISIITSCKNNSETETEPSVAIETEPSVVSTPTMSRSESDQKLIDVCERMDGIVDADIKDDILTVRANISKDEAQKLSDGMLNKIRKYNQDINTVIVCDLGYKLLGYSGK